jgi:PAS domain S-box-containing protein
MTTPADPPRPGHTPGSRWFLERLRRRREARDVLVELAREQALREEAEAARATLRAIFESVPGSCLVLTPDDDYRIVGATAAWLHTTHTRRAEILERPLFEVFPEDPEARPAGGAEARRSLERVRRTLTTDVIAVIRYPIPRAPGDGGDCEERYWSIINAPVLSRDGELAWIIQRIEDVTGYVQRAGNGPTTVLRGDHPEVVRMRMEAEIVRRAADLQAANERLRDSEARYRELIQALPAAVHTCDARGRVLLYNQAAVEVWGEEPEPGETQWCGSFRLRRLDGSELPRDECPPARAIRYRAPVQDELIVERRDGRRLVVQANATPTFDAQGNLTGAIILILDRTRQSAAEAAQAHLAALVDSSDDAIISKDLDGTILTWNGGAERIFGWRASEIVGRSITTIVPPEFVDEQRRILERIRRGERVHHFETVRVAKDGRRIDVSLTMSPINDAAGKVVGASKISRDITESKRIARALAESDRRKDQFLATLAHELRNPLAALASGVELLALPDAASHLASTRRMMGRQTRHLVHLVDDLMDLSRISRGIVKLRPETLDVRTIVERAIETVRPALDAQQHLLVVRDPGEPLVVRADPTRLEQALVNLLTNATKFTPPRGRIEVSARRERDAIVLSVRDNGIGMSPELLPHVFDVFAQSEQAPGRAAGGLGIGLSLVKSIAALHGGAVEAFSAGPGKGSRFDLTLPALPAGAQRDEQPPPQVPARERGARARSRRVLVVDDNEDAAMGLSRLLEYSGHVVRQAYSGPDALRVAAEFRPHAILLDLGLPDLDGYEVARRLRADPALGDVLLIALSGYCQEGDRRRSREAGFDHHVAKPAGHQELLELLAQAVR